MLGNFYKFDRYSHSQKFLGKTFVRSYLHSPTKSPKDFVGSVYKNLRHDLKSLKRIHITDWLIMTFEVDLNRNFILFVKISHRDDVYKR